jgi:hypothetical protein
VAATLLVAATGALLWPLAPAHSGSAPPWSSRAWLGPCVGASGITVVVDFHQLGGGAQSGCDNAEGHTAAQNFTSTGFPLEYVQQTPGFTCRVSGKPASDPCVRTPPATAYWSLWWSDGRSGSWSYATVGVGSLKVPQGGYVAFSWQGQSGRALPGISPTPRRAPEPPPPSDTPSPDRSPDKPQQSDPPSTPDKGAEPPEDPVPPTESAPDPDESGATPSAEPSEDVAVASGDPSPTTAASPDAPAARPVAPREEPGRLPGWLSAVLVLGLAGAATAAWWWRRTTSAGP